MMDAGRRLIYASCIAVKIATDLLLSGPPFDSALCVVKLVHLVTFINYGIKFALLSFNLELNSQGGYCGNWT